MKKDFRLYQKPKATEFTPEGFSKLEEKYRKLKEERPLAVADLKKSRELGDLSENGYYKAARQRLSFLDRQLARTGYLLKNAVVKKPSGNGKIELGSKVALQLGEDRLIYALVGREEANPSENKISVVSPLGRSLLGKMKGDTVIVISPGGERSYSVLSVE